MEFLLENQELNAFPSHLSSYHVSTMQNIISKHLNKCAECKIRPIMNKDKLEKFFLPNIFQDLSVILISILLKLSAFVNTTQRRGQLKVANIRIKQICFSFFYLACTVKYY